MPSSFDNNREAQVIALAAMLQCAHLVDKLATSGECPSDSFNAALQSLFQFDPESPEAIYGGLTGINVGLLRLKDALEGAQSTEHRNSLRYALGMLHLQKKLAASPELLDIMRSRLQHVQFNSDHFSNDINQMSSKVAAIYKDTISTFKFRIQVNGNAAMLQNSDNADKIRTLLLAGIRAAVLWRQVGGRRWQLLLSRQALLSSCNELLRR